jgi:hypothetical protein
MLVVWLIDSLLMIIDIITNRDDGLRQTAVVGALSAGALPAGGATCLAARPTTTGQLDPT